MGTKPTTKGAVERHSRAVGKSRQATSRDEKQPVIVAVDDEPGHLERLAGELESRYGSGYRVVSYSSPRKALEELTEMVEDGEEVALVLADQWMPEMNGVELLTQVHSLDRETKRGLMVEMGDATVAQPILSSMALGRIDCYLVKIWRPRNEEFHRLVTDLLEEWGRSNEQYAPLEVFGAQWDPEAHAVRDLLDRNSLPYAFHSLDSQRAKVVLSDAGLEKGPFPVIRLPDGTTLAAPSHTDLADRMAPRADLSHQPFDVAIVGAGPAGLSAAVYGASEGLRVVVIEREAVGGQAGTSSLIRNFLGFPRGINGNELAQRAYEQAWLFGAQFVLMREVERLEPRGDIRALALSDGTEILAKTVVIATGVTYRRLGVPSLDAFIGTGVFYGAGRSEAKAMQGQHVYVVGAGNSAGQSALHLATFAERVTLLARGDSLSKSMSEYLVKQIDATDNIHVLLRTVAVGGNGDGHLQRLTIRSLESGSERTVPAAALFVLIGTAPHTDWLDDTLVRNERGFIVTGPWVLTAGKPPLEWLLYRRPRPYEASVPGVFAVGDVRAGSVKRVATAVGEGAIAVDLLHQHLAEVRSGA